MWLAEAYKQAGMLEEARNIVETLRSDLKESPNNFAWGFLTRVSAKLYVSQGYLTKALHSIKQSSSVFEIRGSVYERAVNRIVLAHILESSCQFQDAIRETEEAITVFERLKAAIDL